MSHYGRLYVITNLVNGKQYVGQTRTTLAARLAMHHNKAARSPRPLYAAMRKYGREQFTIVELAIAESADELDWLEIYWVGTLGTVARAGYNLTSGGESSFRHTSATRRKLSDARRGKPLSPEVRARMRGPKAPWTPERKAKMSASIHRRLAAGLGWGRTVTTN